MIQAADRAFRRPTTGGQAASATPICGSTLRPVLPRAGPASLPSVIRRGIPAAAKCLVEGDETGGGRSFTLHKLILGQIGRSLRHEHVEKTADSPAVQLVRQLDRTAAIGQRLSQMPVANLLLLVATRAFSVSSSAVSRVSR